MNKYLYLFTIPLFALTACHANKGKINCNPYGFDGEYQDRVGYYLTSRHYLAQDERFSSHDIFDNFNDYQFGGDDPVNAADPSGHFPSFQWHQFVTDIDPSWAFTKMLRFFSLAPNLPQRR